MATNQFEFSEEQNTEFRGLAGKMSGVGGFLVIVGLVNLILAGLLVAAIYQDKLPADWVAKLPAEAKTQLASLPPANQLWPFVANGAAVGLIYTLLGWWTRSAASSFRNVARKEGQDIDFIMDAVGSLRRLYGLIYTLLLFGLLLLVGVLGWSIYNQVQAQQAQVKATMLEQPETPPFDGASPLDGAATQPAAEVDDRYADPADAATEGAAPAVPAP